MKSKYAWLVVSAFFGITCMARAQLATPHISVQTTNLIVGERQVVMWDVEPTTFSPKDLVYIYQDTPTNASYSQPATNAHYALLYTFLKTGTYHAEYRTNGTGTIARTPTITVSPVITNPLLVANWPPSSEQIILFGDDIAAGLGATNTTFVKELNKLAQAPLVTAAGLATDTTVSALARLNNIILTNEPATLLICLRGANDKNNGIDAYTTLSNIRLAVNTAVQAGWVVMLVGTGTEPEDLDGAELRRIALDNHVAYHPNILDSIRGTIPTVPFNGVKDAGYATLAARIFPAVMQLRIIRLNIIPRTRPDGFQDMLLAWNSRSNSIYLVEWAPTTVNPVWAPYELVEPEDGRQIFVSVVPLPPSAFFRLLEMPR